MLSHGGRNCLVAQVSGDRAQILMHGVLPSWVMLAELEPVPRVGAIEDAIRWRAECSQARESQR